MNEDNFVMWYKEPAKSWEEALPIGNGQLGAMIFGGVGEEKMQLNEITVWSGKCEKNTDRAGAYKELPFLRDLLKEGRYAEAQEKCLQFFTNQGGGFDKAYKGSYQTLGDVIIAFENHDDHITDYRRWLDLNTALAGVGYTCGGSVYRREIFSSAVHNGIVKRITVTGDGYIDCNITLKRIKGAVTKPASNDSLIMEGTTGDENSLRYVVRLKVQLHGGSLMAKGNTLYVKESKTVTMYVAAHTDYVLDYDRNYRAEYDPDINVVKRIKGMYNTSYKDLAKAHREEYGKYFSRVVFDIGNDKESKNIPTDERLINFKKDPGDLNFINLYYQFGRYLLISCSRPDNTLPANLQGLWGDGLELPWHCDYHANINVQMNYWPAGASNVIECEIPLINLIKSLVKPGRKTAREYFNVDGWTLAMQTNAWGWTSPGWDGPWGVFFCGGAWLCLHLWEHFAFSQDVDFLQSIYDVYKESCEFYKNILVIDNDGYYITSPSSSPENEFEYSKGKYSWLCEGAAIERQIIYELFNNYVKMSIILNKDEKFREDINDKKKKIRPIEIGKDGRIMEWNKEWDEPEKEHRHVSHLFALYPGTQMSNLNDVIYYEACKKTLESRGDGGTGWSMAWKINFWARLYDGERAYTLVKTLLNPVIPEIDKDAGGTYLNLFDAHPPFQIDGNFGAIAGINEMVIQSHMSFEDTENNGKDIYVIDLLPALPGEWREGTITGLKARGGFEVSITWSHNRLQTAEIKSCNGGKVRIRTGKQVNVYHNKKLVDVKRINDKVVELDSQVDRIYTIY